MDRGRATCPQCGAPLPPVGAGVALICPYCRAAVRQEGEAAPRQLLMADRGDRDEAAAILGQHLAASFEARCAVLGGGEPRLAPLWSVVTAAGDHLCGPATRAEAGFLSRLALPALPARPLAPDEALPAPALPADRPLAELLAGPPGAPAAAASAGAAPALLERAWLIWVPVRFWEVSIGGRRERACTVADLSRPLLAASAGRLAGPPPLDRAALAPAAALAGALAVLGRLLPWPLHAAAGAVLTAAFLWGWRPQAPGDGAAARARTREA
jgi:hypothetical protein